VASSFGDRSINKQSQWIRVSDASPTLLTCFVRMRIFSSGFRWISVMEVITWKLRASLNCTRCTVNTPALRFVNISRYDYFSRLQPDEWVAVYLDLGCSQPEPLKSCCNTWSYCIIHLGQLVGEWTIYLQLQRQRKSTGVTCNKLYLMWVGVSCSG